MKFKGSGFKSVVVQVVILTHRLGVPFPGWRGNAVVYCSCLGASLSPAAWLCDVGIQNIAK